MEVSGRLRGVDEIVAEIAGAQHGLVTRAQLLGAGVSTDKVKRRLKAKLLVPMQLGVYRVGPLVAPHATEMAAVLACGPESAISHNSAAALWQLPVRDDSAPVDVTVPTRDRRKRPGIRIHRCPLLQDEVTLVRGIRTTTPARTLIDLAGASSPRALEQALALAERSGLTTRPAVAALLARHPKRPGARLLRPLLLRTATPAMTRSKAEEHFLALLRKVELPEPELNVSVAGPEVDFLWRAERVVVEVDGFAFHASRKRFEGDRRKDAALTARGFRVIRVTWRQIVNEPDTVLVRVAQTLAAAALSHTNWAGSS